MALTRIHEHYAVSDDGSVWSYKTDKWLKLATSSNGYACVRLNGKTQSVHRLVAEAYCDKGEGCDQVNHINGDKQDNRAENLEWVTASENRKHAWATGLQTASEAHKESARNAGKTRRLFSHDEVRYIRKLYDLTFKQRDIAKLFETSQAVIQYITSRKTYSEVI